MMNYDDFELVAKVEFVEKAHVYRVNTEGYIRKNDEEKYKEEIRENFIFSLVIQQGVLENSPEDEDIQPFGFSKLSAEEKKTFLEHITSKIESDITQGYQWVFFKDADNIRAYGGNLVPEEDDEQIRAKIEELQKCISSDIEIVQTNIDKKKIFKISVAIILSVLLSGLGAYSGWAYKKISELKAEAGIPDSMEPPDFSQTYPANDVWKFYRKHFPDVYKWLRTGNAKQTKAARDIIKYEHIARLWSHTNHGFWGKPNQTGSSGAPDRNGFTFHQSRMILFDFFNNNEEIAQIWNNPEARPLLKETEFGKLFEVYSLQVGIAPAGSDLARKRERIYNKVFYWQSGDLGIPVTDIEKLLRRFNIGSDDWEMDDQFNADYKKGSFKNFSSVPVTVRSKAETDADTWYAAVYYEYDRDGEKGALTELTLFKDGKDSPVYIHAENKEKTIDALRTGKRISELNKNIGTLWYLISSLTAREMDLNDMHRKTYGGNNIEARTAFFGIAKKISEKKITLISPGQLKIDEDEQMVMRTPSGEYKDGYGFKTTDPITGYLLLNALRAETLNLTDRNAEIERRENYVSESHILLARLLHSSTTSYETKPARDILRGINTLESFTVVDNKSGIETKVYNAKHVVFVKDRIFSIIDNNTMILNSCPEGKVRTSDNKVFYLKKSGDNCIITENGP